MMRAIVLAGGFAKRLWPLTLNRPKPLLEVCGRPILDYVIEKVRSAGIRRAIVTVNRRFEEDFRRWLRERGYEGVELVVEKSTREEEKPGAVAAIAGVLDRVGGEDALVVAGDNIFTEGLEGFLRFYRRVRSPVIGVYRLREEGLARLYANVVLDEKGRVVEFVEKPEVPRGPLIAMCLYALPNEALRMVREYLAEGGNPDAPGYFIEWLVKRTEVYGYVFGGLWFDIGDMESYRRANEELSGLLEGRTSRRG